MASSTYKRLCLTSTSRLLNTDTTTEPQLSKKTYKKKIESNITAFLSLLKDIELRSFSKISDLQEKIKADLADINKPLANNNSQNIDLLELMALSCTDAEIDFLETCVRDHALRVHTSSRPTVLTYGRHYFQLLVALRKTEKLVAAARNRRNNILFKHHTTTEIVLNYLTQEKMYREIGEILVDRLPKYFKSVSVDNDIIDSENNKKMKKISHIPFTHMEIYTNALLKMDTEKAYYTFKEMVDYIYKNNGEVSKHTVLRLLYYTIRMKHTQFGYNIFYTDVFARDHNLKANLFIMLHSRANRQDKVIENFKNMFNKNIPIYPHTFKIVREDIQLNKVPVEYKNYIDLAYKRALRNNLIAMKDFIEIVYGTPDQSPEIFETLKDE